MIPIPVYDTQSGAIFVRPFAFLGAIEHSDLTSVNDPRLQYKNIYVLKLISATVLSNFHCHANLADTAANLVHNTKNLFNVKLYY